MDKPRLYIVVPCYNEQEALPLTEPVFLDKLTALAPRIAPESRLVLVDDGSADNTWELIKEYHARDARVSGLRLGKNRGHQNALLAGLMEAKDRCELTITIDCDGQDDISAMEQMVDEYRKGCDIVYGVRKSRETDTWFKRTTARSFYKLMSKMGVEMIYDHADYRLVSAKVLQHFAEFGEVNIFLRGMFPLVGFKSTCVYYDRNERLAGKSHYPLSKMLSFAIEGITSLSIKPLTLIVVLGLITCLLGFAGIVWAVIEVLLHKTIAGWASTVCIILFLGGVQLLSIGVIGEYIGKIYLETKHRPRYIISEKTWDGEG